MLKSVIKSVLCRLSSSGATSGLEMLNWGRGHKWREGVCCLKLKKVTQCIPSYFDAIVRDHFTVSLTCNKGRMAPLPLIGCSGTLPQNSGCLPSTFLRARDSEASFDGSRTCTVSLGGHNFVFSTLKQLIRDVAVSSALLVNLTLRLWLPTSKRLTRVPIFLLPFSKTLTLSKPTPREHPV